MGVPIPHPPFWHCPTKAVWLREVNDVSAFAGRRRRAGFPFSERVSGGIVNMEPEMEDKTLELMVRFVSLWHPEHRKCSVSFLYLVRRRGSIRRQEWAEAACRERWRRKEGGPEIRGRAWNYRYIFPRKLRILVGLINETFTSTSGKCNTCVVLDKMGEQRRNLKVDV